MKIILLLFFSAIILLAQNRTPKVTFDDKKFEIGIFLATTSSGPADEIANQMIADGYNISSHDWFFSKGEIYHPFSRTGIGKVGFPWLINVKYFYKPYFSFGLMYSLNETGMTSGYNSSHNSLLIYYEVKSIAAMAWLKTKILSFGIGPAIHITKNYNEDIFNSKNYTENKIGLVGELSLVFPIGPTLFYSGIIQYRFVGNSKVGPYKTGYGDAKSTFNVVNANFNHFILGLGVGLRIK